jgi:hypothetical protein
VEYSIGFFYNLKKKDQRQATHILMKELEPSDIFPASIADIVQ